MRSNGSVSTGSTGSGKYVAPCVSQLLLLIVQQIIHCICDIRLLRQQLPCKPDCFLCIEYGVLIENPVFQVLQNSKAHPNRLYFTFCQSGKADPRSISHKHE